MFFIQKEEKFLNIGLDIVYEAIEHSQTNEDSVNLKIIQEGHSNQNEIIKVNKNELNDESIFIKL